LLAIKYPDMLCRLIIGGANTDPDGLKDYVRILMKIAFFFTRSNKIKLMLTQPHITVEELNKIVVPTLVLAGRNDVIKEENTKLIASSINGSVLKILRGESHSSYVLDNKKLIRVIREFIDGVACGCHDKVDLTLLTQD